VSGERYFENPNGNAGIRKRNCSGKEGDGKVVRIWEAGR